MLRDFGHPQKSKLTLPKRVLVMCKISVVMPIYRSKPHYLEESIKSLLNQTYSDFELILIMDRSQPSIDNQIFKVVNSFSNDKRLKLVVNKVKHGVVRSLNKAISISAGEYIARADDDDFYHPCRFEEQIQVLNSGYQLVGSWAYVVDVNGRIIGEIRKPIQSKEIREKMLVHNPFVHSSVMVKRDVLEDVGLYNPSFETSEDYELWLRIVSKGYLAYNIPKHLVYLRVNPYSVTRGKRWLINRVQYVKCKAFAVKYGWRKPSDILLSLTSPASFFIPSQLFQGKALKLINNFFSKRKN